MSDLLDECAKLLGSEAALRREVESLADLLTKEEATGSALKQEAQVAYAALTAISSDKFKQLTGACAGARERAALPRARSPAPRRAAFPARRAEITDDTLPQYAKTVATWASSAFRINGSFDGIAELINDIDTVAAGLEPPPSARTTTKPLQPSWP